MILVISFIIGLIEFGIGLKELGIGLIELGIGLTELGLSLIELGIGLIKLGIGLIQLGIGPMELGICLRINNARRTDLTRVPGLVYLSVTYLPFPLNLPLISPRWHPNVFVPWTGFS